MRFRSIVHTALLFAALGTLVACSDDDNSGPAPTAGPSFTRTATGTQGPANTATATRPAATSTATVTVPPPSPTPTQQTEATDTPTQEVSATDTPTQPTADTPTPTETPTIEAQPTETPTVASAGLGVREFTVKRPGSTFDTSALGGIDVSLDPWLSSTLKLEGGIPDENGVATIQLKEDVILGWTVIDTSVACMKLFAEGSSGTIACNGGVPQGVIMTADSNGENPPGPITIMTGQGDPSPAGSLSFTLTRSVTVNLPAGSSPQTCLTTEYPSTEPGVFTSANGQAVLLNPVQGGSELMLDKTGEPFDCANWTNPDGPGQLSGPVLGFDQAIGDVANILFLSGHTTD